jgi:histidinol phosphatase-like enzyme
MAKQKAIIVDVDGTIAKTPYPDAPRKSDGTQDWNAWIETTKYSNVIPWCKEIVMAFYNKGYKIIFLTARNGSAATEKATKYWLDANIGIDYELIMRSEGDKRDDFVIKREAYFKKIALKYDVLFAIDDKRVNIEMFRDLGIAALHCDDY